MKCQELWAALCYERDKSDGLYQALDRLMLGKYPSLQRDLVSVLREHHDHEEIERVVDDILSRRGEA